MRHRKRHLELTVGGLRVVSIADGESRDPEIRVFVNGEGRGDGRRHRGVVLRRDGDGNGLGRRVRETVGDDVSDDWESAEVYIVIAIQRQRDRPIRRDGNTTLAGHRGFLPKRVDGIIASDRVALNRERIIVRVRRDGADVGQNIEGR